MIRTTLTVLDPALWISGILMDMFVAGLPGLVGGGLAELVTSLVASTKLINAGPG